MAIKVNNVDVIDNNRKFIPVTIQAGGTVGTAGSVLASTGSGIQWITVSSGSSKGFTYFAAATV